MLIVLQMMKDMNEQEVANTVYSFGQMGVVWKGKNIYITDHHDINII